MALVAYPDSSDSDSEETQPRTNKRKINVQQDEGKTALPPLPAAFQDLYSSTVRTSTQDDPSLHGGRKRATPHVEGNWPTHVYLEWHPNPTQATLLSKSIATPPPSSPDASQPATRESIHSLLQTDLGVSLPLHISLSRPLVLRTEQRHAFLAQLEKAAASSSVRSFTVKPAYLRWHPNESGSRYFLVLSLQQPEKDELSKLLGACNGVAKLFGQPLLYTSDDPQSCPASKNSSSIQTGGETAGGNFHISIAWSLAPPSSGLRSNTAHRGEDEATPNIAHTLDLPPAIRDLEIPFSEVKVRIGQDVTVLSLPPARR